MDLRGSWQALQDGALLVVETAESAYRLGALDAQLKPWVRDRLTDLRGLLDSCDTQRQLAEDSRAVAQAVADYSKLREELFSDLHHFGPEPGWRVLGAGARQLAIRAQSVVLLPQPTFVLRRLSPGMDLSGAQNWEFTVLSHPSDPAKPVDSFVAMVFEATGSGMRPVQVSKELEDQRAWYQQLEYGFRALGMRPDMRAIYNPDARPRG
ncbi:hypothetical protein [Streptacidiphilus sp. P02-A3a]|uniref:hypothetical protein n=1 Tax=Streptacidiphilus sp. P02-A3a TaxID=2704468 RepID=UPI0015FA9D4C|nr:hypothetical protein [Streptacidiphilus sp. P02-A3a]QMU71154.1 hypothetical protein GXP74_25985 [Streptacidiphilus sp. P02-A3a]